MKSFLQEYGITIVVATIIMALIGVAIFFKTTGGNSLKAMTNNFLQEAQLAESEATPPEKPTPTVSLSKSSVSLLCMAGCSTDEVTVTTNSDGEISVEPLNGNAEARNWADATVDGNTINFNANAFGPIVTVSYTWVIHISETENYKAQSIQIEVETTGPPIDGPGPGWGQQL